MTTIFIVINVTKPLKLSTISNSSWFIHMRTIITMFLFITKGRKCGNKSAYHNHWWKVRKRRRQSQLCRELKSNKSIITKYSKNVPRLGASFHTKRYKRRCPYDFCRTVVLEISKSSKNKICVTSSFIIELQTCSLQFYYSRTRVCMLFSEFSKVSGDTFFKQVL